jgi:transposase-like protein
VTERPDQTAQGYRRFRCRNCGTQFNERSGGVLNRASLPSDIIAFVVFCRRLINGWPQARIDELMPWCWAPANKA